MDLGGCARWKTSSVAEAALELAAAAEPSMFQGHALSKRA